MYSFDCMSFILPLIVFIDFWCLAHIYILIIWKRPVLFWQNKKCKNFKKKLPDSLFFLKRENETGLHVRYQIGIWVRWSPARVATMLLKREVTRKPLPAAGPSSPNIRYLWIKQVLKRLLSTTWFLKKSWTTKSLPYLSTYVMYLSNLKRPTKKPMKLKVSGRIGNGNLYLMNWKDLSISK